MAKLLFLPGAGGSAQFWRTVADRLTFARPVHFFAWPGLGNEPSKPDVNGIGDLVKTVQSEMDGPCDLIAQSMGGVVAIKTALAAPDRVRRMVLTGTSGGVPTAEFNVADWRPAYFAEFPRAARWIAEAQEDLSANIGSIAAPTLLLWGADDPISPPAIGRRLAGLLPNASLEIIAGGRHDFPQTHAQIIAPLIERHLG
jgi:pimeloyl-ACP methyl ester carboxylesterase